jgi:serpin B
MLLLVPDELAGLTALESALDAAKLADLAGAMRESLVRLFLPRFELDPGSSLSLREDLEALGMPLAFDPGSADFSSMTSSSDPLARLSIGAVFHRACVRTDEKGTEAAAATAVAMRSLSLPPLLQVDRPFLFLLRDNASGLIVFLGRVSDPAQPSTSS